jgi:hypothetical protein
MTVSMTLYRYAECHYADCRSLFVVMLSFILLRIITLSVVMLSVVAPLKHHIPAACTIKVLKL